MRNLVTLSLLSLSLSAASAAPYISEIATNNGGLVKDSSGASPDWIEVYNPESGSVNLTGYSLTDDKANLRKWGFPNVALEGQKQLLVFASGKEANQGAELHAPFKLSSDVGYLALVDPSGKIVSELDYPGQRDGFSYGVFENQKHFFKPPTPNAANQRGVEDFVADTKFSVDRGFYDKPIDVAITSATPGSTIVYTTDGSDPRTSTTGKEYTAPLKIDKTTVLRASAKRSGWESSNADTQTYIFLADVIKQSKTPEGFPAKWKTIAADYAMDPRVTDPNADKMQPSLRSLGTISFVGHVDDFFGTNGIYSNTTQHGAKWERPVSMEWINPDGSTEFQVNCGLRIQGGYFRDATVTQKHSLRVLFKSIYGPGKFRHDVFKVPGAAKEFDGLNLRAGANDGYAWADARNTEQFTRDEFGRRLQLAMGHAGSHGTFVHVYLNGLYWGLYNLCERPNEDHSATYYGGQPEQWYSNNAGEMKNAGGAPNPQDPANNPSTVWTRYIAAAKTVKTYADYMKLQGKNPDGSKNPAYPVYFDAVHYIDYILSNVWGGNWDWPNKNFWFGRLNSPESTGFKFYVWDFENTMGNNRGRSPLSMKVPRDNNQEWVWQPHAALSKHPWYQVLYADRIQRHLFNDGVLTPGALTARYKALADFVEPAIWAESARWGDDNINPPQGMTHWIKERDWLLNDYLLKRTGVVLGQLKTQKLYPSDVAAPVLSQHGGSVAPGYEVSFTGDTQNLYYTTDGSEPTAWHPETGVMIVRDGAKKYEAPFKIAGTTVVKARYMSDTGSGSIAYSAMTEAVFVVGVQDVVISDLMYHPAPPSEAETKAGYNDASDFEYIVLTNVGSAEADLTGLRFDDGITFDFTGAKVTKLAPGAKVIIVRNGAAFQMRYGSGLPVAGEFRDKLQDTGERVRLVDALGTVIHDFTFDDAQPWPVAADGQGKALALKNAASKPPHGEAGSWTVADPIKGSVAPALGLAQWLADNGLAKADEDGDGDGYPAYFEYALGADPKAHTSRKDVLALGVEELSVNGQKGLYLTARYPRRPGASGVSLTLEASADLKTWSAVKDFVEHGTAPAGNQREWVILRAQSGTGQRYLRLRAVAP